MFDNSQREKRVEVIVTLADGRELQGEMLCGLNGKISVALNSDGQFVELHDNSGNPLFISKASIATLEPAISGHRAMPALKERAIDNGSWAKTLQVSSTASHEAVKSAYHALAKQYHPDVFPDHMPEEMRRYASEMFKRINEAWQQYQSVKVAA